MLLQFQKNNNELCFTKKEISILLCVKKKILMKVKSKQNISDERSKNKSITSTKETKYFFINFQF